jgi:hypothetical protein
MTKRALFAVAGFFGLCLSMSAQQTQRPEQLPFDGTTLDRPWVRTPSLTLEDRESFFFSTAFGSMRTTEDFLPAYSPWEPQSVALPNASGRRNPVDNVVDLRALDRVQFGGEIGFLYGKSSGKYGREDFQTYIIGTVGNEKFSITAGYLYQESSGRVPRWRR